MGAVFCLPLLMNCSPLSSHCQIEFFAFVRIDGTGTAYLVGVKPLQLLENWIPRVTKYPSILSFHLLSTVEVQYILKQVFLWWFWSFLTATGIFKSTCSIDVRWFPFDVQRCELKFGSWTYGGYSLDLKMLPADVSSYIANGEWDLVGKKG